MDEFYSDAPPPTEPEQTPAIVCPQCGTTINPTIVTGPVIECPQCGTQFFPPSDDEMEDAAREAAQAEIDASKESELSATRIRHFSAERRAAYRFRSFMLIGMLGCVGIAIQLVFSTVAEVRKHHHWGLMSIGYVLFTIAALIAAGKFGQRMARVQSEINAVRHARMLEELEAAKHEPDLSTLSDGSQYVKNLEQLWQEPRE